MTARAEHKQRAHIIPWAISVAILVIYGVAAVIRASL